MKHQNKNLILDYYCQEGDPKDIRLTGDHIHKCHDCQQYIAQIEKTENILDLWEEERTPDFILERVISEVSTTAKPKRQLRNENSNLLMPILQIAFGVIFILLIAYIITLKLSITPLFNNIENNWFVETFGNFGLAVAIILTIGTFFSLAFTPVLLFESRKQDLSI